MHQIGPYVILGELGRGATSVVYRGLRHGSDREVAIKTIDIASVASTEQLIAQERLRREVSIGRSVTHPGIVRVFDVGHENDLVYIAMELIPGRSLQQLLRSGRVPSRESMISLLQGLGDAIDHIHSLGILHRDIKPSNILFRENGSPVLTDFGIARSPERQEGTRDGFVVGTIQYLSPEALDGRPDTRSDQWAFAAVTYEALTGQTPFNGATLDEILANVYDGSPAPLKSHNSTIPESAQRIINKALSKDANRRYGTCTEFASALQVALSKQLRWDPEKKVVAPVRNTASSQTQTVELGQLTMLESRPLPDGFSPQVHPPKTSGTESNAAYEEVKASFSFYRDGLKKEYDYLSRQAHVTYWLWVITVGIGISIVAFGVISMLLGRVAEGAVTAATSTVVFFIQRIFQQREDFYRQEAARKNSHLEYGNHWLLVIQSIERIHQVDVRHRRQARLVDILTNKLRAIPK